MYLSPNFDNFECLDSTQIDALLSDIFWGGSDISDYEKGLKFLKKNDPVFSELYAKLGYLNQRKRAANFSTFVSTIVGQQLSGKAAETIFNRLLDVVENDLQPRNIIRIEKSKLRQVGISKAKVSYILSMAEQFYSGVIDLEILNNNEDAELYKSLTAIRGIGPWSAKIIMLFNFQRLDAFPFGDVTLEKAFEELWEKPIDHLQSNVKNWSPYSGIVAMYMWSYMDMK